jgi:uncharacterized membrane protein
MALQRIFNMGMSNWNDEKMRRIMGTLLRVGVLSSAIIVVFGAILFFIQHPQTEFSYSTFKGEPERLKHVGIIIQQTLQLRSRAVIQFGLLLLIVTPVIRVAFSFVGFIIEKDWVYTIITLVVMIILFLSLFSNYI